MAVNYPLFLTRTSYFADHTSGSSNDPNSPNFFPGGQQSPSRAGSPFFSDIKLDVEQYFRPLERLHGMGAHGAGVAVGLEVSATKDQPTLQIKPGIAIDPAGKHIFLAPDGFAQVDPKLRDNPGQGNAVKIDQQRQTFSLPTAQVPALTAGEYLVTIQWWEDAGNNPLDPFSDTPWLRLVQQGQGYEPDAQVVLAAVKLSAPDAKGNNAVQELSYVDAHGIQRTSLSVPAQRVAFRQGVTGADSLVVSSAPAGELRAREGGGLQMTVAGAGDHVEIVREGTGNFAKMMIAADQIAVRRSDGNEVVTIDANKASIVAGSIGLDGASGNISANSLVVNGQVRTLSDLTVDTTLVVGQKRAIALGANGRLNVGSQNASGNLVVFNGAGTDTIALEGDTGKISAFAADVGAAGHAGSLQLKDATGANAIGLKGSTGSINTSGAVSAAGLTAGHIEAGSVTASGNVSVMDPTGNPAIVLDGATGKISAFAADVGAEGHAGSLQLKDATGANAIGLDGASGKISTLAVDVGAAGHAGSLQLKDASGANAITLDGDTGKISAGELRVVDINGDDSIVLQGATDTGNNSIVLKNDIGEDVIVLQGGGLVTVGSGSAHGELLLIAGTAPAASITLRADDGSVHAMSFTTSGADCAEQFDVTAGPAAEPGTVMVIGADGALEPCNAVYDARVAGVISGAGDLEPGLMLNERGGPHRAAIALIGMVYCKVDASGAPISAGDLLTTSSTPGHGMKAVDAQRGFGAIIGKALKPISSGVGLIPILVTNR